MTTGGMLAGFGGSIRNVQNHDDLRVNGGMLSKSKRNTQEENCSGGKRNCLAGR